MNILDKIYDVMIQKKEFRVKCLKCGNIIRGLTKIHCYSNFEQHFKKCENTDDLKVVKGEIKNDN